MPDTSGCVGEDLNGEESFKKINDLFVREELFEKNKGANMREVFIEKNDNNVFCDVIELGGMRYNFLEFIKMPIP